MQERNVTRRIELLREPLAADRKPTALLYSYPNSGQAAPARSGTVTAGI
jgi:hypothetical protein